MTGNVMIGILRAQSNVGLAQQNRNIANSFVREGRVRIYEAGTVGDEEGVKEGEAMIVKGEAMKADTFEHLDNAVNDLNSNANVVSDSHDVSDVASENSRETSYVSHENAESESGEPETSVGKPTKGNARVSFSAVFRQSKFDIKV
jgi:hypothetical protein